MKTVIINKYGDAQVLEIADLPKPTISKGELLIRNKATSVNPVDWKVRRGDLKFLTGKSFPKILGGDFSGIVAEKGSEVTKFKEGDEVYGMVNAFKGGAYAEYVKVKPRNVTLKPESLSHIQAAAIPLAGLTAYQALWDKGKIVSGNNVLINGSTGGVGSFAVQMAKSAGANVTGVCSSKNADTSRKLGADSTIDYSQTDLRSLSEDFHIFFDVAGNQRFSQVKDLLKSGGIYITTLPNLEVMILAPILNVFRSRTSEKIMVRPNGNDLSNISKLVEDGKLSPLIDRAFNLQDIREAHDYHEKNGVAGKIAIKIEE